MSEVAANRVFNGSSDCWHCTLVSYEVSYLLAEKMHYFAGYILPGIIFTILGVRWASQLIWEWTRNEKDKSNVEAGKLNGGGGGFCSSGNTFSSLPWEGIVKLILTGIGIIGSVLAISLARNEDDPQQQGKISESEYVSNIRYATIYLFFALSGLMDIVVYYCGYAVLPEGIQSLILGVAFIAEGLTFTMRLRYEMYLEQQVHVLLVIVVFAAAASCIMEVLYDNRLVKFCRSYLCITQGTWLIHGGFVMQGANGRESAFANYPDFLEWVSILFCWHVAANFVLFIIALLVAKHFRLSPMCHRAPVMMEYSTPAAVMISSPSSNHSSPATVQTNVSPATVALPASSMHAQKLGLPSPMHHSHTHHPHQHHQNTFSYIQTKQLPSLPSSSASSSTAAAVHEMHHTSGAPNPNSMQHLPPHMRYLYPAHPDEDLSPSASPAIVEAVPRDHVVPSEEYRTLSREDQMRASIKLKESSLI